jgi:hypothetical protein
MRYDSIVIANDPHQREEEDSFWRSRFRGEFSKRPMDVIRERERKKIYLVKYVDFDCWRLK